MIRSQRMQIVQNLAQDKADKAAQKLGAAQTHVQNEKQRLEQLQTFRSEYWEKFSNGQISQMNSARLHDFQTFITKLDQAIKQQEDLVKSSETEWQSVRQAWLSEHSRANALDKVVQTFVKDELKNQDRVEQKLVDEFAALRFRTSAPK